MDKEMDYIEFYKELYWKEIDRKNEINNSLATPISIISAIVAGLFFTISIFDYHLIIYLSLPFILIILITLIFLTISIFNLIKSYTNFHNGYEYAYLNNTDELNNYKESLSNYYKSNNETDISNKDFKEYIIKELIKTTSINQKNNDLKIFYRFRCNKFLIFSIISLFFAIIPFGINYGLENSTEKSQKVEITEPIKVEMNTKHIIKKK